MKRMLSAAGPLVIVVLLAGCRAGVEAPTGNVPQDTTGQAAVLAVLSAVHQDSARMAPMREAFARLESVAHTRFIRTDQFTADGDHVAGEEQTTRHTPDATVVRVDSTAEGTFARGAFGGLADRDETFLAGLPDLVVPEDPAYLSPRQRESYRYRTLPDTLFWGVPTGVIEVEARYPDQSIQRARLYLTLDGGWLVAYALERDKRALLFREEGRLFVSIRPGPQGGWVPFAVRSDVRLKIPFRDPRRFRTVTAFYDYGPNGATARAAAAGPGAP